MLSGNLNIEHCSRVRMYTSEICCMYVPRVGSRAWPMRDIHSFTSRNTALNEECMKARCDKNNGQVKHHLYVACRTSLFINRLDKSDQNINAQLPASMACPCRSQVAWGQAAKFSNELFARGFVNSTNQMDDLFLKAQCYSFWATNSTDLLSSAEYQNISQALQPGTATGKIDQMNQQAFLSVLPLNETCDTLWTWRHTACSRPLPWHRRFGRQTKASIIFPPHQPILWQCNGAEPPSTSNTLSVGSSAIMVSTTTHVRT